MGKYRKIIAYILGILVYVATDFFDIQIPGIEEIYQDMMIIVLTGFGVYQVPNDPMPKR